VVHGAEHFGGPQELTVAGPERVQETATMKSSHPQHLHIHLPNIALRITHDTRRTSGEEKGFEQVLTEQKDFSLTFGLVFNAFSPFCETNILTAFFSSFGISPRTSFRIPGSIKTRLNLWGLQLISCLRRAKGAASGIHKPQPVRKNQISPASFRLNSTATPRKQINQKIICGLYKGRCCNVLPALCSLGEQQFRTEQLLKKT
jgi:hypothetical protein